MKKADVILGAAVLLICIIWLGGRFLRQSEGACAVVEVDGQPYGTYALDEDRELDVGPGNHISIENGAVRMSSADCPDQICVRQGRISTNGAMITCLPNRVTVQVRGEGQTDAEAPDVIVY